MGEESEALPVIPPALPTLIKAKDPLDCAGRLGKHGRLSIKERQRALGTPACSPETLCSRHKGDGEVAEKKKVKSLAVGK